MSSPPSPLSAGWPSTSISTLAADPAAEPVEPRTSISPPVEGDARHVGERAIDRCTLRRTISSPWSTATLAGASSTRSGCAAGGDHDAREVERNRAHRDHDAQSVVGGDVEATEGVGRVADQRDEHPVAPGREVGDDETAVSAARQRGERAGLEQDTRALERAAGDRLPHLTRERTARLRAGRAGVQQRAHGERPAAPPHDATASARR